MKKGNRTVTSIFIGTLTAIAITFLVALFVSAWVLNGKLQEKTVKYYIMVGQFLACLIGFILTGKITKEKVAIHISASAGMYTLILAVISDHRCRLYVQMGSTDIHNFEHFSIVCNLYKESENKQIQKMAI